MREAVVCALLVLTVPLCSLMELGGVTTSQRELVLVVLLAGVIFALPGGGLWTTIGRATAVCAFVGCTAVSYLRFAAAPIAPVSARVMTGLALMLLLLTAFALCALLAPADRATRRRRLLCALFSPVCFVALNLGLYVAGFHFPTVHSELKSNSGSAQLLGLIGIHTERVNTLPLDPGLNGSGEASALALVVCAVLAYRGQGRLRLVSLLGIPVSFISVLLTDSRGPLAYAVLALVIVAALPRAAKRVVAVVPLLLPVWPAIILFVASHLGSVAETFNRSEGSRGSFVTATGRSEIWSIVVKFLSHFHVEDLIGYGAYGQVRSGVGAQYAYLFHYREHPEFANVHNIALQTILDTGYIGLALLLWFLMVAINSARVSYQRTEAPESAALLVALIALGLFGASEALPGLDSGVPLLAAVIVLGCAAIRVPPSTRLRPFSLDHELASRLKANVSPVSAKPGTLARPTGVTRG